MTNEGEGKITRDKDNMKKDTNECGVKSFQHSSTVPVALFAKNITVFALPFPWLRLL